MTEDSFQQKPLQVKAFANMPVAKKWFVYDFYWDLSSRLVEDRTGGLYFKEMTLYTKDYFYRSCFFHWNMKALIFM